MFSISNMLIHATRAISRDSTLSGAANQDSSAQKTAQTKNRLKSRMTTKPRPHGDVAQDLYETVYVSFSNKADQAAIPRPPKQSQHTWPLASGARDYKQAFQALARVWPQKYAATTN